MRPLLVFIGPSGVGKSALVRELIASNLIKLLPTWTTRPKRPDEVSGESEHHFASDTDFDDAIRKGEIIDAMPLFGLPYRYGLPRLETTLVGPVVTLMGRAHLMDRLRTHTQNMRVYQIEADPQVVRRRLEERKHEGAELGDRWKLFDSELELGRVAADRRFINDGSVSSLYDDVRQAIEDDYS